MPKICVISTAHSANDIRIYLKQIISLKNAGFEIVFLNKEKEGRDELGIEFKKVKIGRGWFARQLLSPFRTFAVAKEQVADAYHLHDPDLLLTGLLLRIHGKKVIYDAHEDAPRQMLGGCYSKSFKGKILSIYFEILLRSITRFFTMNIVAAPVLERVFAKYKGKAICITNYPKKEEFMEVDSSLVSKKSGVCYVGGISVQRSVFEMIEAVSLSNTILKLAGGFSSNSLEKDCLSLEAWKQNVEYYGFVNREEAARIMAESVAGLVIFQPLPNHTEAMPNKMFEYMASGIPVIVSNFPLWKEIVEEDECGICVNPLEINEISKAISYLLENQDIAERMGLNGKRLVDEKYNWKFEEAKLIEFYTKLFDSN